VCGQEAGVIAILIMLQLQLFTRFIMRHNAKGEFPAGFSLTGKTS
jgi:hypothetical protein